MDFFKWVALIVLIVTAAEVIKFYIKNRSSNDKNDQAMKENQERIAQLEERVKTLEKIITDPSENLRREIDNLKQ